MKVRKGDIIVYSNSYNTGISKVLEVSENTVTVSEGFILKKNIVEVNGKRIFETH